MANKKIRGSGDYNIPKTWEVCADSLTALDKMHTKFKKSYRKKQLVSFGILLLEKQIKDLGVKPGEDIEQILGIQAN
jgi:hypothetical protein